MHCRQYVTRISFSSSDVIAVRSPGAALYVTSQSHVPDNGDGEIFAPPPRPGEVTKAWAGSCSQVSQ